MSAAVWVTLAAVAGGIVYAVYKSFTNFNKGTPYEGTGAVGTLGNVADQLSGGVLSATGSAIGTTLYDWTHSDESVTATTLIFTFKDTGLKGAVNEDQVDPLGFFNYYKTGVRYQLKKDASGNRIAVKA